MINYQHKAAVINSGLVKQVKNLKQGLFRSVSDLEKDYYYDALYDLYVENYDDFVEAVKVASNDFQRNTRLKNRIRDYLEIGTCKFVTLTFTNLVLSNTSQETRKRYVVRFLKSQSDFYIANIDFGSEKEREHYHAIIVSDFVDVDAWKYGFTWVNTIIKTSNPLVLAKYVSKLTNHAIKETCKRCHIIYSREGWEVRSAKRKDANRVT